MEDMAPTAYYHHHHHPPPPSHYPPYYQPPPAPPAHHYPAPAAPPPPHHHLPNPNYPPPSHPHHQYYHHEPPFASHYAPLAPHSSKDEVRTLFVAGIPDDVKPREIYNLFREFPGYHTSQLRSSGQSTQAFAFAVFVDQQSALTAMHALNGLVFDLEKESTLFVELAKSNSRPKRSRTDDEVSYSSDKKVRGSAYGRGFPESVVSRHTFSHKEHLAKAHVAHVCHTCALTGVGSNIHMHGMSSSAYSTNGYPSTQSQKDYAYDVANHSDLNKLSVQYFRGILQVEIPDFITFDRYENTVPCPTLFVANLGPSCSEQELTQVFSRLPGFLKLKMQNKNGVPVAFVDFQDANCSAGALNSLQGALLYSSVGEGMRLEYAKSRMGLRKRVKKT